MTASGEGQGLTSVLVIGITQTADARLKKTVGMGLRVMSLLAVKHSSALKMFADDGERQARALRGLVPEGLRTSRLLIVVLPFAKVHPRLQGEIDSLVRRGAQVEVLVRAGHGLPDNLRSIDQKAHDALAGAVEGTLRRRGMVQASRHPGAIDVSTARRTVKLRLLQGLAAHRKWGAYNHSSEEDFWKSRGKGIDSAQREEIVKGLVDEGLIGTKVNDGDNGKGLRYYLRPESKGRLVELFPELKPYT